MEHPTEFEGKIEIRNKFLSVRGKKNYLPNRVAQ